MARKKKNSLILILGGQKVKVFRLGSGGYPGPTMLLTPDLFDAVQAEVSNGEATSKAKG